MSCIEPLATEPMAGGAASSRFEWRPLVRVVPIASDDDADLLRLAETLARQTYDRWELHAPLGGQVATSSRPRLVEMAVGDPRFRPALEEPQAASAHDGLVAVVEPGTRLAPFALLAGVNGLAGRSEELLYGDNDLVTTRGRRHSPFFKPHFSAELLLSVPYLGPLLVMREGLLGRLVDRDPAIGKAEVWDLELRLAELARGVVHDPRVLAHRMARRGGAQPETPGTAMVPALKAHLERQGISGDIVATAGGGWRVLPTVPQGIRASIIIPTRDHVGILRPCIESIVHLTARPELEIIVVDNGSREPETLAYLDSLAHDPRVRVLRDDREFNWSALNNRAASEAHGEVLCFLNNDVEVLDPGWLEELTGWALRPDIGMAGALLLRPDGTVQHAGITVGLRGLAAHPFEFLGEDAAGPFGHVGWYRTMMAMTGACQVVRRDLFERLGGFDEEFLVMFSDVELGVRLWRAGYRNVFCPAVRLLHRHGISRGGDDRMPPRDLVRAYRCFGAEVEAGDPFFSPNLSPWSSAPRVARPGEPSPGHWLREMVAAIESRLTPDEARHPISLMPFVVEVAARLASQLQESAGER
ncbi:MAG TPA: glycosyltransferase family 2 protein [Thermoanaerobaculaceae bacterium]|nr:glycosyltransferase family 2 protein [Thermoanaerobaculaceae bacterium]